MLKEEMGLKGLQPSERARRRGLKGLQPSERGEVQKRRWDEMWERKGVGKALAWVRFMAG